MDLKNLEHFTLIEEEFIEELNSKAYFLRHNETKAEVLYLENDDRIKTFGIGFRTPPVDSTGVAHIVEHCVLSGSRKYRTKEPFMDLINSSMQTFLNAMTFPDKTIYPIATRNDKDFMNLMDVYLDAVFYPRIYEMEEIFRQEGWHLELESKDEDLKYNGVVYNEMRGSYSDPDSQVQEQLAHNLHPDSTYSHDSGGDPHEIVKLKYEEFLDFHRRYYHPSNSYIFLSGKMDIEKVLGYIHEEYLKDFEYQDPNSEIEMNEPFEEKKTIETTYSVSEGEETDGKNYVAYGVDLGKSTSTKDAFMRDILREILIESDSSILMDPLLESGIGKDYFSIGSSSLPLDLFIVGKGVEEGKLEDFVELIEKEIKNAIDNKIDSDLLDATLNKYEFRLKELGIHKGVLLFINSLHGWLYGTSPIEALKFKDMIEELKEKSHEGYIEKYLEEKVLNNNNKIYLVSRPVPGMFKEKDEKMMEELRDYKESLNEEEIEKLIEKTEKLFSYQLSEDTKEDKATIPRLTTDDIEEGVRHLNITEEKTNNISTIYTDEFTNGVVYFDIAFNLKNLTREELPYAGIVLDLITSLSTENYNYKDLNNAIDIHTGGINFGAAAYRRYKASEYFVTASLRTRVLPEKIEELDNLLQEIIFKTKYDDKKRIYDLMVMNKEAKESMIEGAGHSIISTEVRSMMSDHTDIANLLGGRKGLFFLKEGIKEFENDSEKFMEKLAFVHKKIFNKSIVISVAGEKEDYEKIKDIVFENYEKLSDFSEDLVYQRDRISSIALKKSSNVVYVSDGFDFKKLGYEYKGSMAVLSKILSGGYLHTNVRAKGGAYGVGISISQHGPVVTYSYRDPNLDNTFEVYDRIPEYIENLDLSQEELTNYIIATMNQFDPPIDTSQYSAIALSRHFTQMTCEVAEKLKKEAIETTPGEIRAYADMFYAIQGKKFYGVLGSPELIDKSERQYEVVEKI